MSEVYPASPPFVSPPAQQVRSSLVEYPALWASVHILLSCGLLFFFGCLLLLSFALHGVSVLNSAFYCSIWVVILLSFFFFPLFLLPLPPFLLFPDSSYPFHFFSFFSLISCLGASTGFHFKRVISFLLVFFFLSLEEGRGGISICDVCAYARVVLSFPCPGLLSFFFLWLFPSSAVFLCSL